MQNLHYFNRRNQSQINWIEQNQNQNQLKRYSDAGLHLY
jgi:hypothetical protein